MNKSTKFNLKIFQIDKSYYELKDKSAKQIIKIIEENHIKLLRHNYDEINEFKPNISYYQDNEFEYWSYSFDHPKNKYYWKLFLPEELSNNHKFEILEFSFVLFINYQNIIYCVISGSGMNIIRKYIHPNFGTEIYKRIASPQDDIVLDLQTRSIATNVSQQKQVFSQEQRLSEAINYSEIPIKIKLKVRDSLKKNEFIEFNNEEKLNLLEVGSYFYLRKKLNFPELISLIKLLDLIKNKDVIVELTLFKRIDEVETINELDNHLSYLIVEDILSHVNPLINSKNLSDIIELVHPTRLEKFYECDSFIIRTTRSHGKDDVSVMNRNDLYFECTKYIFNKLETTTDRETARNHLYKTFIRGYINDKQATYDNFYNHVVAELTHNNSKYFRIDKHWYLLEDTFLETMNKDAMDYYSNNKLEESLLKNWPQQINEEEYNNSHFDFKNYIVLDRVLKDNIELCDILVIRENKIYFIHVKNGFNAKMRDLFVQILLSARRLSTDLKNSSGSNYLKNTLVKFNQKYPQKNVDVDSLISFISKADSQIIFVMAFKNNLRKGNNAIERIDLSDSNIAKYTLVQVVKEINQLNFGIKLIDISDIN